MSDVNDLNSRLQKLVSMCENIKVAMLGADWESQMEFRALLARTKEEIQSTRKMLNNTKASV